MLTYTKCRTAKSRDKPYKMADSNGLYLEVKPNGVKAWRYRFKLPKAGKLTEGVFAIGDYAALAMTETPEEAAARRAGGRFSLSEARDERTRARALVKQGISPVQYRQAEKIKRDLEHALTFEAVSAEWLALRDREEITRARRLAMLQRVVFPKIGNSNLPVKLITPAHVLEVLKTSAKNNGRSVAAEAQRTMSGIFDLAVATLRADNNPVYPVRKALPANKTQHKRPLTVVEIGALLRDFDGHGSNFQTQSAFKLMWLALCRPSEAAEALDLSAQARAEWIRFLDEVERELGARGTFRGVRDVAAKAAENAARLAALFHVLEHGASGTIASEEIRAAACIVGWHLNEARRLLADLGTPPSLAAAIRLDAWLRNEAQANDTDRVPTKAM